MSEVTKEIVQIAYKLLLNREAETDLVVEEKSASYQTLRDLRDGFVTSSEFERLHPSIGADINRTYWGAPAVVEVDVSPQILESLLNRVRKQWRKLGEDNPYWSVLTHDDFLIQNINAERLAAFYETGRNSANLISLFEKKTGTTIQRGICFELGCGTGRITPHLAQRFDRVIAADISPGNLAICDQRIQQLNIHNVTTVLLESPESLSALGFFDFFYSVIVLQHNTPPIQKLFLDKILSKIALGGACLFQTPGSLPNYSFSASDYLQSDEGIMDMHCLPKPVVLELLHNHRLQVRDVEIDPWIGSFGSYTYFATR